MTSNPIFTEIDTATATVTTAHDEALLPSTTATYGDIGSTTAEDDPLMTPQKPFSHSRSLSLDSLLGGDMFSPIQDLEASLEKTKRRDIGLQLSPILRPSTDLTSLDHGAQQQEQEGTFSLDSTRVSNKDSTLEAAGSVLARGEGGVETENDNSVGSMPQAEDASEESSPSSNDSILSTSSNREVEIQLAQQQAGASGHAFILGLRGAAHRRKMNLTRSRDSLAAKEKERREEAERLAAEQLQSHEVDAQGDVHTSDSVQDFRARPLPKSNRMSGVAGLPKPVKRPVTTPFSPLLGVRRKSMPVGWKSQRPTHPLPLLEEETDETTNFRARPLSKTVVHGGGRTGVPKVPKRPTTTPFSPLLGARRPKTNPARGNRHSLSGVSGHSGSNDSDSVPLGLEFISSETENSENHRESDPGVVDPKSVPSVAAAAASSKLVFKEFQLRSTSRAERRAVFDASRKQRWQARQEEDLRSRRERIRRLERELGELRWEL